MTAVLLKESKHSNKMTEKVQEQSILKKLSYLITQPNMAPLLGIFLIITLVSQVPATLWVIYGQDRYGWSIFIAGVSLASYGICHSIAQAFAIAPMVKRFGEKIRCYVE